MVKNLRVLTLDDSGDDGALLLRELRHASYESTCQRVDTRNAMRSALNRQTRDIILADYTMPHFTPFLVLL